MHSAILPGYGFSCDQVGCVATGEASYDESYDSGDLHQTNLNPREEIRWSHEEAGKRISMSV